MARRDVATEIGRVAQERILVLDGAWGTMLHGAGLAPEDYRGERFASHHLDVAGDPDVLNLTRPELVRDIHRRYLAAGADITTTNTFTATRIGQADYGLEDVVYETNVAAARIAREAAGDRFVAGSVGPLNVTLSLSPKVDEPSFRTRSFDEVKEAYSEQIAALVEGGVDLLMLETVFDTLNAKAAIVAARETAPSTPLWISATIVDLSGRTLSGQTIEAFWTSVEHAEPLIVGVNCSLGARELRPYVAELARVAPCLVSAHPNAGLPNAFGGYDETPEVTSALLREFAVDGLLNIAGSCCGSSHDALERPRAVRDRARHGLRRGRGADERDRLRPVSRADRVGRLRRRRRDRARAGAGRGERPRREHGRRPARRRGGDARVPERDRRRAGGGAAARDDRQLPLRGARGRSALPPGQGDRQLDQPEGGGGG